MLIYATTVNIEDQSAQSLQIKEMCRAFQEVLGGEFNFYGYSDNKKEYDFRCTFLENKTSKLKRTIDLFLSIKYGNKYTYNFFTRDLILAFLFALLGIKTVWEAHQEPRGYAKIVLCLLKCFNNFKILSISDALKQSNSLVITKERIHVYHDGVRLEKNASPKIPFKNSNTALYTGALHKGRDIESLEPLFGSYGNWDFVFVGGKKEEVGRYQKKYSTYKNVYFLGRKTRQEVEDLQKSAKVLLYPLTKSNKLWKYTSPLKLFEYMASGIPIIASNIGSVKEIVDGNNAFIYQDEDGVCKAFKSYLNSRNSKIEKMVNKNLALIEEKYNWKSRVEYIVDNMY